MPENPFARIGPGVLGNDEKNHHDEYRSRNGDLYQKIHYHLRLPIKHPNLSGGHLEQDAARYALEQQCVVLPCPPARKKTVRMMPDDDQVNPQ